MKFKPGAKLQSWAEFLVANRGWISTVEVTRLQAEGNHPIEEKTAASIAGSGNLVVATIRGADFGAATQGP